MKNRIYFSLIFLLAAYLSHSQVTRTIVYEGKEITMLAWNNRMQEHFSFPGMQAFIIVGDSNNTTEQIFETDPLRRYPANDMESYSCFYYLAAKDFTNKPPASFLEHLIESIYKQDLIDRNRVHLVWQLRHSPNLILHNNVGLDSLISSETIVHPGDSIDSVWSSVLKKQTKKQYSIPRMQDMEERIKEEEKRELAQLYRLRKGKLFFELTIGRHQINQAYKTAADTVTMVDFTKLKTLWGINIGYHFSRLIYGALDVGIMYSGKQKRINSIDWGSGGGVTVRASGQAAAMIRYGLIIGWVPYQKERFNVVVNLAAGRLTAIAGGGTATRSIGSGGSNATNISKKKEQTIYIRPTTGIIYKFSSQFYFTSQIQYMIAGLAQPFGSVSALTGLAINMGLGFSISTKKYKE